MLSEILGKFVRWQDFVRTNKEGLSIITLQKLVASGELNVWAMTITELPDADRARRIKEIEFCLEAARQHPRALVPRPDLAEGHVPFLEPVLFLHPGSRNPL